MNHHFTRWNCNFARHSPFSNKPWCFDFGIADDQIHLEVKRWSFPPSLDRASGSTAWFFKASVGRMDSTDETWKCMEIYGTCMEHVNRKLFPSFSLSDPTIFTPILGARNVGSLRPEGTLAALVVHGQEPQAEAEDSYPRPLYLKMWKATFCKDQHSGGFGGSFCFHAIN